MNNIWNGDVSMPICGASVNRSCEEGTACKMLHSETPYIWQVQSPSEGWISLTSCNEELEFFYCNPMCDNCIVTLTTVSSNALQINWEINVNFEAMVARAVSQQEHVKLELTMSVRRLSTPSYVATKLTTADQYVTQWRWYYEEGGTWNLFGMGDVIPSQYTLESKYLFKQEIYRFMRSINIKDDPKPKLLNYHIDFTNMSAKCLDPPLQDYKSRLKRRPQFISLWQITQCLFLLSPAIKASPHPGPFPSDWVPIDSQQEYEMVPLNPETMRYQLVASEMLKTLKNIILNDIFAIQNPFLWQRFISKKTHLDLKMSVRDKKNTPIRELQLFHGTPSHVTAEAILTQNFDPRLSGKNAVVYGDGCYFAVDANYSDKYCLRGTEVVCWMFMARVLVGEHTQGCQGLRRPPPIDPNKPHGDLYDSCVDNVKSPKIYVVFENDQCYPEYLISYSRQK